MSPKLKFNVRRAACLAIAALPAVAVAGCGTDRQPRAVQLHALISHGFKAHMFNSSDSFAIPDCGHPIGVWMPAHPSDGAASLFVCRSSAAAQRARVPRGDEMPGHRLVRGRFFVVLNGNARLRRHVLSAVDAAS
jgi:hypothetical protein